MTTQRFKTIVVQAGSRTYIPIPFNPNEVWGVKQRHHITGTINGRKVRGALESDGTQYVLPLGAAWRRDNSVDEGREVEVELSPEGPQADTLAPDLLAALESEPAAKAFGARAVAGGDDQAREPAERRIQRLLAQLDLAVVEGLAVAGDQRLHHGMVGLRDRKSVV